MIRLLLTYGAVASTGAAAWVGWGQGQAQIAGSVLLAALAFVAVRFWLLGEFDLRLRSRLPRRETVASLALVGLIVTAGVAGPMAQPAAAQQTGSSCSSLDVLAAFATSGIVGTTFEDCYDSGDVENVAEADGEQTELDIYDASLSQQAHSEVMGAQYDNYLNDTESVAWMKAESAIAQSYKDGDSKSQAKTAARQAIADYYATKQINLVNSWNVSVKSAYSLSMRAQNESNISATYISQNRAGGGDAYRIDSKTSESLTLVNSNTTQSVVLNTKFPSASESGIYSLLDATVTYNDQNRPIIHVRAPDTNTDSLDYMDQGNYATRWNRIQTQNNNLQSEVDPFVNNTWDAYTAGTINSSDVLSRNTQMFEYAPDGTSDDKDLYTSVAALSSMGLDTPELNGTGTMEVTDETTGATYDGLLMAREAPNGSWSANTTYNATNIGGPVFVATTTGTKVELDGEFTIGKISATDGSSISNLTAEKTVYKTSNTTELLDKMDRIQALRDEIEAKTASGGGGGGWDFGGNSYAIVALVAVAAVLLLNRT